MKTDIACPCGRTITVVSSFPPSKSDPQMNDRRISPGVGRRGDKHGRRKYDGAYERGQI